MNIRQGSMVFVACVVALGGAGATFANPVTGPLPDIVFGNLGGSGTNALDTSGHSITSPGEGSASSIALSFTTGPDGPWQLGDLLRLGIGNPVNDPVPVALILSDNGGNPDSENPVAVYALGEGQSVTTTGFYDFTQFFANPLAASTSYWLLVADDGPAPEGSSFTWYDNESDASPAAQNDSVWSFGDTKLSTDGGQTWQVYTAGNSAAFSITAVPEPSMHALAVAGLVIAGLMIARKNKRGV